MKNKLIFLSILSIAIFILSINFCYAKPPFTTNEFTNDGLIIEYPSYGEVKVNQSFKLNTHVFNYSDGTNITNETAGCLLHIYASNGSHIFESGMNFSVEDNDFFVTIPGNLFVLGHAAYIIQCQTYDGSVGGAVSGTFLVTLTGETLDKEGYHGAHIFVIIFIMSLFVGNFFLGKSVNLEKWHNKIKRDYEGRNYVKLVLGSLGYNIMKNSFVTYYLIGLLLLTAITSFIANFNMVAMYDVFKVIMNIYLVGIIIIGLYFFSNLQEWIVDIRDQLKNEMWGIE